MTIDIAAYPVVPILRETNQYYSSIPLCCTLFVILQTSKFCFTSALFQAQKFSILFPPFCGSPAKPLIISASCLSLFSIFSIQSHQKTQSLQNRDAQSFLQWNNKVCILFSTLSLRFSNIHFVFLTTTQYDPMLSENSSVSSISAMTAISTVQAALHTHR